jgi:hypothetical protein
MNPLLMSRLLKVLSAKSLPDLDAENGRPLLAEFGVGDLDALQKMFPDYPTAFRVASTAREQVDRVRNLPQQKQVSEALCLVWEASNKRGGTASETLEAIIYLVDKVLVPYWPDAEQKSYQDRAQILRDWKDYFLSYTRRQAPETNFAFQDLIKQVFAEYPAAEEIKKENFLARIIWKFMNRQNIRGFLDEHDIQIGEVIGEKVRPYCRQSFGFVQLVEDVCFEQGDDINWCFEEYREFKSAKRPIAKAEEMPRFFFFLAGRELTEPANLPQDYRPWFGDINDRLHCKLAGTDGEALKLEVRKAAIEILRYKEAVVKEILFG